MSRFALRLTPLTVLALLTIASAWSNLAAQQPGVMDLAAKMPNGVNAVMVMNVANIRESQIARENAWFLTSSGGIESGMNFVPAGTNLVLLSANMDYQTMQTRWSAALLTKDNVPTIDQIRQVTDGRIDEIRGVRVVETPDDYFIATAEDQNVIAAYQPALRQGFTAWLRRVQEGNDLRVPDYLERGLKAADEVGTDLKMAFNLENQISRNRVADMARDSELLRTNGILVPDFAKGLASVQGVTLAANLTDEIRCEVRVDFADDITFVKPIADQLVLEMMENAGVYLKELDQWEPVVDQNSIRVSGTLSVASFRKIISLGDGPKAHTVSTAEEVDQRPSTDPAALTKNHFDAVNSLVSDAQSRVRAGQPLSTNSTWLRKSADKIDQLPTLDVDALAIEFGNYISTLLRDASLGLINTREDIKVGQQRLMASGARSGGGGSWGWSGGRGRRRGGGDGSRLRRSARNSQLSGATMDINAMFTEIATVTRDVRQQLTDKFQIQF